MEQNKVLLLCNDIIGDTIIRLGIMQKYINYFGYENTYFLTFNFNYEIVKLVTDKIILVDKEKFKNDENYKRAVIDDINSMKFYNMVNLITYRGVLLNELFARELKIPIKIAYEGEEADKKYWTMLNNEAYTSIIPCIDKNKQFSLKNKGITYVLVHQLELLNYVTKKNYKLEDVKPNLKKYVNSDYNLNILNNSIVFGMGASKEGRMYPYDKFAMVLKQISSLNYSFIFLGKGQCDKEYLDNLLKQVPELKKKAINFIDKLSIVESFKIISKAKLFVGVESGLWNASYALGVPSVVIYGGGHFGRFMHQSSNIKYIFKPMNCYFCRWECKYDCVKCIKELDYKEIVQSINLLLDI